MASPRRMTDAEIAASEARQEQDRPWRRMTEEEIAASNAARAEREASRPVIGRRVEGTPYDILRDNAQRVIGQAVDAYGALRPLRIDNRLAPVDAAVYVQLMRGTWVGKLSGRIPGAGVYTVRAGTNNANLWSVLFDMTNMSRRALEGVPRSLESTMRAGIARVTAIVNDPLSRARDDYDPQGGPVIPRDRRRMDLPFGLHHWLEALGAVELVEAWRTMVRESGIDRPIAADDPAARRIRTAPAARARPMDAEERAVARAEGPAPAVAAAQGGAAWQSPWFILAAAIAVIIIVTRRA